MAKTADPLVTELLEKIETAAGDVRDARKAMLARIEQRRRLVHEAVDQGIAQRAIAKALGGGTGLVTKILANPGPEGDDDA